MKRCIYLKSYWRIQVIGLITLNKIALNNKHTIIYNMKRLKIAALLLTGASLFPTHSIYANSNGWGRHQTKDTITGLILGGTIGGIVGHQQDKQKEGIIIGSVIGSLIGNKGGKGRDQSSSYSTDPRYSRYNESRSSLHRRPVSQRYNHSETIITDPDVLRAQQRAEALEQEVQLERARIEARHRREAQLKEARAREEAARAELSKLRNR